MSSAQALILVAVVVVALGTMHRSDDAQLPIVGDIDLADLFADIIHQGMMK